MSKRSSVEVTSMAPTAPPPPCRGEPGRHRRDAGLSARCSAREPRGAPVRCSALVARQLAAVERASSPTPVVKITKSDVEAIDAVADAAERAQVVKGMESGEMELLRLAAVDLPVDEEAILVVVGGEAAENDLK